MSRNNILDLNTLLLKFLNLLIVVESTGSTKFNSFDFTNLQVNLTLGVVIEEVVVEQVIQRLLHILNNFGGLSCYIDIVNNIVREIVAINLITVTAVGTLVAHKAVVRTSSTVKVTHVNIFPLTLRGNGQNEEQFTDRHIHSLNRYDVVCKQTREYTTYEREYNGFKRTGILCISSLSQKFSFILVDSSEVLFQVA